MQKKLTKAVAGNHLQTAMSAETFVKLDGEKLPVASNCPLTINYYPGVKFLEAKWQRPVCSEEYRQCIRYISLCIAILRAEYFLVNFTQMGNPTEEDQLSTEAFLRKALQNTTLVRSARVLANTRAQQLIHEAVVSGSPALPYQVKAFLSVSEARKWLFEEIPQHNSTSQNGVFIPAHCTVKELKKLAATYTDTADETVKQTTIESITKTNCHTDFMEVAIDKQRSLLTLRWLRKVKSREYRYGILKAGRALIEHKIRSVMVNNQRLGMLTLEDQTWVVNTMAAILNRCKMEQLAIVYSADIMQQMASESVTNRIKKLHDSYLAHYFLTEEEASEWLGIPGTELTGLK